ncbi:histone H1 [Pedobacter sp. SYSU D00535]|uniref:histone H1 n=1 Tax=Pedobacter sp. SYSU D00535 TaxID=2810308 RepID=UPI001A9743B9|nr:histone H1 [Pedobacter sp. SYSU D00535]
MEKFNQLKSILESVEKDAEKFYTGGNNAAGTRVRKALQEIKNLASDIRKEVTEIKNKEK